MIDSRRAIGVFVVVADSERGRMDFTISEITDAEQSWVLEVAQGWGADFVVTRGRKVFPAEIEGFYAIDRQGDKIGLVTFEIVDDQCEVVTLDAFRKFSGIGTALLERVRQAARARGCRRFWLITTTTISTQSASISGAG